MFRVYVTVSLFFVNAHAEFMDECWTINKDKGCCVFVFNCMPVRNIYFNADSIENLYNLHTTSCGGAPLICCPENETNVRTIMIPDSTTEKTTTIPPEPTHVLPESPNCGRTRLVSARIAKGSDAKLGEFPWMAALGYQPDEAEKLQWLCGGSLVTEKHVMTAAHCVRKDLLVARLGDILVDDRSEGANPVEVPIVHAVPHEKYNRYTYENDIAILGLAYPVGGQHIKPICLPVGDRRTFERYFPFVAGWGKATRRGPTSPNLKVAILPVVPNELCKKSLEPVAAGNVIDDRVLCAGYAQGGIDTCEGDSGGPMMWAKMDGDHVVFYAIGIVSWGYICAKPGYPAVYTRVTHFIDWIKTKLY